MSYGSWKPYVPVSRLKLKAQKAAKQLTKKLAESGAQCVPVTASRGAIAKTFWGKAWCENLERYSDFANRLPRGRTYLRAGSVLDLDIEPGEVRATVVGTQMYDVEVRVAAVADKHWKAIGAECAGSIDSMVELLRGRLPPTLMQRLSRAGDGLFPAPREIEFECSCPDWASMCKHVAAVLYGIGVRLDAQPELLFELRRVDAKDLLSQAGTGLADAKKPTAKSRVLEASKLGDVFGIDFAEVAAPATDRSASRGSRKPVSQHAPAATKPTATRRRTTKKSLAGTTSAEAAMPAVEPRVAPRRSNRAATPGARKRADPASPPAAGAPRGKRSSAPPASSGKKRTGGRRV